MVEVVDDYLQSRQQVMSLLKQNLLLAQERMKVQVDKHRVERSFLEGDWVYLRLQPYKQRSLKPYALGKLSPKFYGPFQVLHRVGEVAYKLELLADSLIHPVFHVSCLKAKLGQQVTPISQLPSVSPEGIPMLKPEAILKSRSIKLRSRTITQVLIQWQGCTTEDATWEDLYQLQQKFPHLVGKVL